GAADTAENQSFFPEKVDFSEEKGYIISIILYTYHPEKKDVFYEKVVRCRPGRFLSAWSGGGFCPECC
ncbi:MAG: hypothetical protein IKZ31_05585, partial [Lentisphaeria bacterium]|nr:hypothetical protein [Lentisphaeria bacterium]